MATPKYNTYVGMRYVPIFDGEWDRTKTYEPLTIVSNQGNSYTSRTFVPTGIDINNTQYWALTGNYNAQVEYYRQEVRDIQTELDNTAHIVTPEMFDAVGDGETDDATALQNAINYAGENNLVLILTKQYYASRTLYTNNSVCIEGLGDMPYYPSILSDAAIILNCNHVGLTLKNVIIGTNDGDNSHSIGVYIQADVDDAMCFFDGVHFRNLSIGINGKCNSVDIFRCHFSLCNKGIKFENGTNVFEEWVFKSITIYHNRFHDTNVCIETDSNMGSVEEYNNGIEISYNFCDKCGAFYYGTPFNLMITNNHHVFTREITGYADAVHADGSGQTGHARSGSYIYNNQFVSTRSSSDCIHILNTNRAIYIKNNVQIGGLPNLIHLEHCTEVTIDSNECNGQSIVIDNTGDTVLDVFITNNKNIGSGEINANCECNIKNNIGFTFGGNITLANELNIILQQRFYVGSAYDAPIKINAPILSKKIIARILIGSTYYYIPLNCAYMSEMTVFSNEIRIDATTTVYMSATFTTVDGATKLTVSGLYTDGNGSHNVDCRGIYYVD